MVIGASTISIWYFHTKVFVAWTFGVVLISLSYFCHGQEKLNVKRRMFEFELHNYFLLAWEALPNLVFAPICDGFMGVSSDTPFSSFPLNNIEIFCCLDHISEGIQFYRYFFDDCNYSSSVLVFTFQRNCLCIWISLDLNSLCSFWVGYDHVRCWLAKLFSFGKM